MSRGPGRVEQSIATAFETNPHKSFSVTELTVLVYSGINRIEKKHRVSVIRAANRVASHLSWMGFIASGFGKERELIFGNPFNHDSYVEMRTRASWDRRSPQNPETIAAWRGHVDWHIAERDGDEKAIERFKAKNDDLKRLLDHMGAALKKH